MKEEHDSLKKIVLNNPDFKFEGKIVSHRTTAEILGHLEEIILKTSDNGKFQRKTYNILVDMIQRMTGIINKSEFSNLYVKIHSDKFYILTESTIPEPNKSLLAETIDKLNNMLDENDTLKNYYKELLRNATFSDRRGDEISLIDVIRRSNNRLLYNFKEIGDAILKIALIATIDIK